MHKRELINNKGAASFECLRNAFEGKRVLLVYGQAILPENVRDYFDIIIADSIETRFADIYLVYYFDFSKIFAVENVVNNDIVHNLSALYLLDPHAFIRAIRTNKKLKFHSLKTATSTSMLEVAKLGNAKEVFSFGKGSHEDHSSTIDIDIFINDTIDNGYFKVPKNFISKDRKSFIDSDIIWWEE